MVVEATIEHVYHNAISSWSKMATNPLPQRDDEISLPDRDVASISREALGAFPPPPTWGEGSGFSGATTIPFRK